MINTHFSVLCVNKDFLRIGSRKLLKGRRLFLVLFVTILMVFFIKYMREIRKFKLTTFTQSQKQLAETYNGTWVSNLQCYGLPQVDNEVLVIPDYAVQPNSIFFVETSCQHEIQLNLTERQACAYESAARAHPTSEVLVLFNSPITLKNPTLLTLQLLKYSNLKLVHLDLDKYLAHTPLENFGLQKKIWGSNWPTVHMSDILRLLTLWRYGGTYLDWDFITFRSFNQMENFIGAETNYSVNNAIINFSSGGTGTQIIDEIINELRMTYRGKNWSYNGPVLLTKVLKRICNETDILEMTPEKCKGFTVFPPPPRSPFYPVLPSGVKLLVRQNKTAIDEDSLSQYFGFHMYNSMSKRTRVKKGSRMPYDVLASRFCPGVYSVFGDLF